MPLFFRFPTYIGPLARNAAISAALAVAAALPWPLAGVLVGLAATLYLTTYGFTIIERGAEGFLFPDEYPPRLEPRRPLRPLKLFVILLVAFFAIGVVAALTAGTLTALAFVAAALLLPASAMTLAISDSLRQAINPLRLFDLARRVGPSYLVLCLFLLLLLEGSTQAFELVAPLLGETLWLLALVSSFVGNYFFMIMCALMGYVLFQYGHALDLAVIGSGEQHTLTPLTGHDVQERRWDASLGRMVAAGDLTGALALIDRALAQTPDDLSLHVRLHKLLVIARSPRLAEHADRYFALLLQAGRRDEARALIDAMRAQVAGWHPGHADAGALSGDTPEAPPLATGGLSAEDRRSASSDPDR